MNSARIRLPGHPDAVCDMVAAAIVDEYTRRDPTTRVALSVMGGRGALFVAGDVMSKADFDVAQLITRTLGAGGVISAIEPFVSIEPVVADRATSFGAGSESPVAVIGYATQETAELIPAPLAIARRIAKSLNEQRLTDESWFWFGGDAEIVVEHSATGHFISVRVEHGAKSLEEVRAEISEAVRALEPTADVRVNELGTVDVRGIGNVMGSSGRSDAPYGSMLPSGANGSGLDISRPEKAGQWLARAAARSLVKRGAKAALVHAVYRPGERTPAVLTARDERGKDLSAEILRDEMSLDRILREWWRPNLNVDATRWGFVGEPGLPWEM